MEIKELLTLRFIPCHRLPSRSLVIHGKSFLCWRCLSILIGYLAIPLLLLISWQGPWYLGFLLQIPLLMDGVSQYKKWRTSNQWLRIATGLLSGVGQSMIVVLAAGFFTKVLMTLP